MPSDLLILDACVLIDFLSTDRNLLRIAGLELTVHVASVVLAEVDDVDEGVLATLGVKVVEPSVELSTDAAGRRGALSFEDWVSLLLAEEEGWTCVTNDGRLRKECAQHNIDVLWGLELLAILVERGRLAAAAAVEAAEAMHRSNPRYISAEIVARFRAKLAGPRGKL